MTRCVIIAFLFVWSVTTHGQTTEKLYSVFILNFARTIQWPENDNANDFIIGILDQPNVAEELKTVVATKTIGSKKIKIKEFTTTEEISSCQILFVPPQRSASISNVASRFPSDPVLIVTEKKGASQTVGINFFRKEDKLQLELNLRSVEARGLRVPASIKNLCVLVN